MSSIATLIHICSDFSPFTRYKIVYYYCSASHEERLWARQEVMWERDMKRWDAERALWTMREQQMQQQICDLQALVVSDSCSTWGKIDAFPWMMCHPAMHNHTQGPHLHDSRVGSPLYRCSHAKLPLVMP